ncbi:MAG TPA: adenosylmethionine--8-amino-7-oxononanoate transaminase [Thermosulfidibacter takaii]|uniref:Adenosylmethionine-8-amino-7-oxononanoate aminotransferase n=1 Tax=Thermosulfidibacter takaii TaxID=412593 RepID=A0A7C0Y9K7_9BACT|nr:adenosylmethionine--8-amino-7-oxononanoate transaminase [Thermosulfidibacter takaii]
MEYQDLAKKDFQYLWHPFTQMSDFTSRPPLIIERGEGIYLIDTQGNRYIDGVSSLWVNLHGHRRPEIDQAIKDQLDKIAHSTMLGMANVPAVLLAERLVEKTPENLTRVFFSDNGSTAMEIALKIAYQYWTNKGVSGKARFVSLKNAYHGDTLGAVSVGGIDLFHSIYRPLLFPAYHAPSPYCYRCPLDKSYPACALACLEELEKMVESHRDEVIAIVSESAVQGAAGMIVMPQGYMRGLREIADKYGVPLILDEVAMGFGRTGKMWACEHEKAWPDIMALSKGITNGYLPLAATLTTEEIYSSFLGDYTKTFYHGHSYTGNPLACAAALANLEIFDRDKTLEQLPPKVQLLSQWLEKFQELSHVGDTRQKGLVAGIELVKDKATKEPYPREETVGFQVIYKARDKGVAIRPLGDVIVIMPPLVIPEGELDRLMEVIYECVKVVTEG